MKAEMNYILHSLIFLFFSTVSKGSNLENRNVTIAVVEFQSSNASIPENERILANSEGYIAILNSIETKDLDMIIYPELTLRTTPQTASEAHVGDTPCASTNYPEFMRKISCAARDTRTYIVINFVEKSPCSATNCHYNTDVVFDRSGRIATKYQKYNLFGEKPLDRPAHPQTVVFESDFGVRFGIFTCFDVLFKSPAQNVLAGKVDAVIFPLHWYSELPFLTALQVQQMWAHAHNVKLFAAGANNPLTGTGGSGVYSGRDGTIMSGFNARGGSQVYLYRFVPGESPDFNPQEPGLAQNHDLLGAEMDGFVLMTDPSVSESNSTILDASVGNFELRHRQLRCRFDITMTRDSDVSDNSYVYRMMAYAGVRSFNGVYNGGVEICALIACVNASLASCGRRFANYGAVNWPITFERIEIAGYFEKSEDRTQFPSSLLGSIRPINASETLWEEKETVNGDVEKKFSTKTPQNRLLTFAIYGRNFAQDSPPDDGNSSGSIGASSVMLAAVAVLAIFTVE